jgi:DNA-binding MarR family transcriptional regulator
MPKRPIAVPTPLRSILHLLYRAGQRADGLLVRHAGATVTPRQFMILQAVAEANGLSQTDIMTATGIDRSSVADLVGRLVRQGWLSRRRLRRDVRAYAVRLTPEGRRILAVAVPAARATEEALLSQLAGEQRQQFLRTLSGVAGGDDRDD